MNEPKTERKGGLVKISDLEDEEEMHAGGSMYRIIVSPVLQVVSPIDDIQASKIEKEGGLENKRLQDDSALHLLDILYPSSDDERNPKPAVEEAKESLNPNQLGLVSVSEGSVSDEDADPLNLRSEVVLQSILQKKNRAKASDIFSVSLGAPVETEQESSASPSLSLLKKIHVIQETPTVLPPSENHHEEPVPDASVGMNFTSMVASVSQIMTVAAIPKEQQLDQPQSRTANAPDENGVDNAPAPFTFSMMTNYSQPPGTAAAAGFLSPTAAEGGVAAAAAAPSVSTGSARSSSPLARGGGGGRESGYKGGKGAGYSKYPRRQSSLEAALEHAARKKNEGSTSSAAAAAVPIGRAEASTRDRYRELDRDDYRGYGYQSRDKSSYQHSPPPRYDEWDDDGGFYSSSPPPPAGSKFESLRNQYSLPHYRCKQEEESYTRPATSCSLSPDRLYRDPFGNIEGGKRYVSDYGDNRRTNRDRGAYYPSRGSSPREAAGMKRKKTVVDDYETALLDYESDNDNYKTNKFKTKNSKNITLV